MMKRGDIYFATLDPTIGSEIKKRRPVLIVSNNANNKVATTITVVPLTSNTMKVYPFEVLLSSEDSGLQKQSKAQCHQIRTISTLRLSGNQVGRLSDSMIVKIDAAIRLHLAL